MAERFPELDGKELQELKKILTRKRVQNVCSFGDEHRKCSSCNTRAVIPILSCVAANTSHIVMWG